MIADRPSATALLVALSVLRRGRAHALPESSRALAAQALQAAGGGWRWLGRLASALIGRWLLDLIEWLSLPGLARHHCQRKRHLLQALRQRPGPRRWLWLGVGLDGSGRALRQQFDGIELQEFDHPSTLALRQRLLGSDSAAAMQLPRDRDALLQHCAAAPSTLVLEGVLMYLPARTLLRLLQALSQLPQPPRLLFSALDVSAPDGRGFARPHGLTRRWLAARGESFLWRLPPTRMSALLRRHGYRIDALWSGDGYGEYLVDAVHSNRLDSDAR